MASKRKHNRKTKKLDKTLSKIDRYPVAYLEQKDGTVEKRVLVPLHEVDGMFDVVKAGLIQRVGLRVKSWFSPQTSDADDEGTTDIGSSSIAVTIGDSLFGEAFKETKEESTRRGRYSDYNKMDEESTELSRALSVTVDNVFMSREGDQESYKLSSEDSQVLSVLEELDERVKMQEELPTICRSLLKVGDDFEEVVIDSNMSIVRLKWLNQQYMYRQEDMYGRLVSDEAFVMKGDDERTITKFAAWQVIHLRHDHQRGNMYGRSFFYTARRPWRLLQMMEDGVVMERLTGATDRIVYYIPLPKGANEQQARRIVDETKQSLKSRSIVDPNTGKIDIRKTPIADDEGIFIGTYPENPAKVERLGGSGTIGRLEDVEFMQNKMFMATGVPKSYLGLERDINAKATLSWQDIEYARILRAIQKEMATFQRKVYNLQLVLVNRIPDKQTYTIEYPPISFVDEEMRIGIEETRWNIAVVAKGLNIPLEWILEKVMHFSEDEVQDIITCMPQGNEPVEIPEGLPAGIASIVKRPEPSSRRLAALEDQIWSNKKIVSGIRDLKNMITYVQQKRLNQPLRI